MSRTRKLIIGVISFTLICAAFWGYMLTHQFNTDVDVLRIIKERYGITTCQVVSKETIMRNGPSGELYHLLYNASNGKSYPFTLEVNRDNGLAPTAYADDTIALALFSEAYDNYAEQFGVDSLTKDEDLWKVKFNSQEDTEKIKADLINLNQILLQIPATTNVNSVDIPVISDDPYLTGFSLGTLNWTRDESYTSLTNSFYVSQGTYFTGLGCAYGKDAPLSQDVLDALEFTPITFEYNDNRVTWDLPSGFHVLLTRIPDLFKGLGIPVEGDFHKFSWEYDGVTLYSGVDLTFGPYYDPLYLTQVWYEYTDEDYAEFEATDTDPGGTGTYKIGANPLTEQPLWSTSTIFSASAVIVNLYPDIKMYDENNQEIEVMKEFILGLKETNPDYKNSELDEYYERMYGNGDS